MKRIFIFVWIFCINSFNVCNGTGAELSFKDKVNLHHAFVIEKEKWEHGVISFKIYETFSEDQIAVILFAMYEIEKSSCIRFVAHDISLGNHGPFGPNYVMIRLPDDPQNCNAEVGCKDQGEQIMNVGAACGVFNTILRELLRTIGFNHHHQRSDRDNFIDVNWENVNASDWYAFEKYIDYDARTTYLTPFDYSSIMMYRQYDFSMNNEVVISPKVEGARIEPSEFGWTKYDKILLNRLYNCHSVDKKASKLFYEDEDGNLEFIVNYHEVERAKRYFFVGKFKTFYIDNAVEVLNVV